MNPGASDFLPIVLAFLVLTGIGIWIVQLYEKRRSLVLAALAKELGFDFISRETLAELGGIQEFPLFGRGHRRRVKNVLRLHGGKARITVFDYQYTTGGGKNSHTHRFTVLAFGSQALTLPEFTLVPENFLHRLGAALGFEDIDFEDSPEFSDAYALQGPDESALRKFFDPAMRETFLERKGISIQARLDEFLMIHRRRLPPDQISTFITGGYDLFRSFTSRLDRKISGEYH